LHIIVIAYYFTHILVIIKFSLITGYLSLWPYHHSLFQASLLHLWNTVSIISHLCCNSMGVALAKHGDRWVPIHNRDWMLSFDFSMFSQKRPSEPDPLGVASDQHPPAPLTVAEQIPLSALRNSIPTQAQACPGGHQLSPSGVHFPLAKPPRQN
jgi:hypothetical protein